MPLANKYLVTFHTQHGIIYGEQTLARDMDQAVELVRLFSIANIAFETNEPITKIMVEIVQWGGNSSTDLNKKEN